jgi:hypothetical protein
MKRSLILAEIIRNASEKYYTEIDCYSVRSGENIKTLRGLCGIASYALYQALIKEGFRPEFKMADLPTTIGKHCWVELNGKVIDVTATQFGVPDRVFITRPTNRALTYFYESRSPFSYRDMRVVENWKVNLLLWEPWSPCSESGKPVYEKILAAVNSFPARYSLSAREI